MLRTKGKITNTTDVKSDTTNEAEEYDECKPEVDLSIEPDSFFDLRTKRGQILFIIITSIIALFIAQLPLNQIKDIFKPSVECKIPTKIVNETEKPRNPTYWIYGAGGEGQWVHINKVLKRLGLERVTENEMETADLLWAHDYPFTKLRPKILSLKPHQKVNHFPGCGYITNKVDFATTNMKYVPRAFKLPKDRDDFKAYAVENPKKLFVVKHHQHRNIKIKRIDEINLNDNLTFVQEFVENPLLIDGHKFDIGVYTIITSVDPLRVYIYYGDILFRYCSQKYYPFDPENVDKYIVGDDYLPTWEIPSLSRFYNTLGFGMKSSFDAFMRVKGRDPEKIWAQVEDAIRITILEKEPLIKDILQRYRYKQNFFEMARFDLIVDDNLAVYNIEANMSPNLSSAHFKQNSLLYEQVIYHALNLVGVGHYLSRESFERFNQDSEAMLTSEKNIMVNGDVCAQMPCAETCSPVECQLCKTCLTSSDVLELKRAYQEHVNRGDTRRIFPARIDPKKPIDEHEMFQKLSPKNQMMARWFHGKCKSDSSWC